MNDKNVLVIIIIRTISNYITIIHYILQKHKYQSHILLYYIRQKYTYKYYQAHGVEFYRKNTRIGKRREQALMQTKNKNKIIIMHKINQHP